MDWSRWVDIIRIRARALLHRKASDAETRDEIAFHLAMQTQANLQRGMTPAAAAREARRALGSTTRVAEDLHDLRAFTMLETLWQDLRYAFRMLGTSPG